MQRASLIDLEQRHAGRSHGSRIGHARRDDSGEWRNQARVAQHGARAALLGPRRVGLRANRIKLRRGSFGAPRDFVHLLRTHALLRLKLLVALQRARGQLCIGLRGGLLILRRLHAGLRLIGGGAQRRVVEHHQRLSGANAVSLAHQHLLNAAHHLRGDDCGLPGVNSAGGSQVHRHLLLPAFNHPRLHGLWQSMVLRRDSPP